MFLDELGGKYTNNGIGRECLLFHKDRFGSIISCAEDNGNTRSDGSHLTGGAPGFVIKMKQEEIIFDPDYEEENQYV